MHYAFDVWMVRKVPSVGFERYVNGAMVHGVSERPALMRREAIGERLAEVGLRLPSEKTKVVYCHRNRCRGSYEHMSFTFLGTNSGRGPHGPYAAGSSARFCQRSARFALARCEGGSLPPAHVNGRWR
jgi:hypothetical protein